MLFGLEVRPRLGLVAKRVVGESEMTEVIHVSTSYERDLLALSIARARSRCGRVIFFAVFGEQIVEVLHFAGVLVLSGGSLRDDFEQRGRASILFLLAYVLGWIPLNIWLDGTWQSAGLFFNLVVAADLAVAYWASRGLPVSL